MAEALGFAEQLGYPSESKIFEGGPNDYLYCSPDNQETEVCCFMADHVGFPKLEVVLSRMPFEEFSDFLAYTHLTI
jgi:hypothetical protein